MAALEDKIVQHALATVLNAVYEADFVGFSFRFRPGRGQHDALDALWQHGERGWRSLGLSRTQTIVLAGVRTFRCDAAENARGKETGAQRSRPLTLGYGLSDSLVGLAAWIVEKFHRHLLTAVAGAKIDGGNHGWRRTL